jgi:hypothetical protein
MRVTGDCFFFAAARFAGRFTAGFLRGAADFEALRVLAPRFVALFDLFFALPVLREAARFDAVDDLRAFRPDDFDAVAMIIFLVEGTGRWLRKIRARRKTANFAAPQNQRLIADCNRHETCNSAAWVQN